MHDIVTKKGYAMRRIGALEAGGTKMVLAVLDETGKVLDRKSIPTLTPAETMPEIIQYFKDQQVDALGVASFGPVDVKKHSKSYGHILMTPKLPWRQYDILGTLKAALPIPMALDTDVNASAIGESKWGAAKDVNSCLYITIGTGVGLGVIIDGKPMHGALHSEGGHIILQRREGDLFEGNCPSHGACLEGLVAGPSIQKHWGKPAFELMDRADVWEEVSYYIAQAVADFILVLSPEKVILGGGVMKQTQLFPLIRKQVVEMLNGYLDIPEIHDIDHYIVAPALVDDQGIMGCAAMIIDNM